MNIRLSIFTAHDCLKLNCMSNLEKPKFQLLIDDILEALMKKEVEICFTDSLDTSRKRNLLLFKKYALNNFIRALSCSVTNIYLLKLVYANFSKDSKEIIAEIEKV